MVQTSLYTLAGLISAASLALAGSYTATYTPQDAPYNSEQGQTGYNQCGTGYNQTSECQNAYLNAVQDFCIWAPPEPGPGSAIGSTEQIEVAWCMKSGYGTRLIPDGTITGAHLVVTPDYVQVTGVGNLTNINVPAGDDGGELDPHGATGEGNPIGGLVFSSAFGQLEQIHEWTNFVSDSEFCFRACKPGPNAAEMCQHIYDVMGCDWNMPANYDAGVFEACVGDSAQPMGVYGSSTFSQGQPATPAAHPIPSSSSCTTYSTISNGQGVLIGGVTSTSSKPLSTTVRSQYHSGTNRHSRHFTPSVSTIPTATTITFPSSPTLSSVSLSLVDSTQVPTSSSASFLPSSSDASSFSQHSSSRHSSFDHSSFSSQHMSSQHSSFIPSSSHLQSSSFSHSFSSHSHSSFLSPTLSSPSSQASSSPSHSSFVPSSSLSPDSSSHSSSSYSSSAPPEIYTSPSSFHSLPPPSSSTDSTSTASTSSIPSSNPQTQIGSQCPIRTQGTPAKSGSSTGAGGAQTTGNTGAASTVPLVGWERLILTIFAVVVGSSVGALVVL
ncbi:hypothetical protein HYDPIDRAFT_31186 [Hydnomerulius pinastri MD-312]|uniref:Carbohydrate-binding module family 13 protein n=1 Tax=Hydnomerulius pinastri MD-312 TaxID=994086 RepID=A0A0C9VU94_9AGAM|nr:hypothetical protein HYDPIDRAFT_31186 [Hydnomerulius pinastri MD-312]